MIDNSYTLAQQIEDSGKLKESNYRQEGALLCKLWMAYNWSDEDIKDGLYKRVDKLYPLLSEGAKWEDVNKMIEMANRFLPLRKDSIVFSKEEVEYIHSLDNIQAERILFAFLYLYKKNGNDFRLVKSELKKVACVNWNPKTLQGYITFLIQNGYVKSRIFRSRVIYSINDELSGLYNDSNKCIEVSVEKNIVYYYLNQIGYGRYFYCDRCGCIEEVKSNRSKYCSECYRVVHSEQRSNLRKHDLSPLEN